MNTSQSIGNGAVLLRITVRSLCSMSHHEWAVVGKKGSQDVDRVTFPTLDLHGYTLEAAIKRLVEFLEQHCHQIDATNSQNSSNVKVVTGMGSHSGSSGGPVLKTYVNKFLVRHSYQFTFYSKGGYFIIPTIGNTGSLSYRSKSCEMDSKIVTMPRIGRNLDDATMDLVHPAQSVSRANAYKVSSKRICDFNEEMPTLQAVVRSETEFQWAVDESSHEFRIQQKEMYKEQKIFHRVLETSRIAVENEEEFEKSLLCRAIQESIEFSEHGCNEDDAALKEAIELSERECDDYTALEEAISASLLPDDSEPSNNDDAALNEAIELSERECDDDTALKEAIVASLLLHD